jgi:hypothetical protein
MSFRDIVASYKIKQIRNRMEPADIQFPHALKSPKHTWSGLAKKAYIDTIKGLKIDLLLDLNLEASHFTSSILLNFPDAIRVGRGNHRGNPFYNLEIKTKYLRDEKNIYRSMLETLSVLKNITTH